MDGGGCLPLVPPLGQRGRKPLMALMGSPLSDPPHAADTLALSHGDWAGDAVAVAQGPQRPSHPGVP